MKRVLQPAICLILAMFCIAGCKKDAPTISLGSFEVDMPGTVTNFTEQLPLTQMGLGVSTPLVMTIVQTVPQSHEIYIAIAVEWEQAILTLGEKIGDQWTDETFVQFSNVVQQSIMELLMVGAAASEGTVVTYGGIQGMSMAFQITSTVEEGSDEWPVTNGEVVSFVSQKRLIMLIYAADKTDFSNGNKHSFFSSLVVHEP